MIFNTSEEANSYIKNQLEEYLQDKGIDTTKNFCCLNPEHDDNHPSMGIDKKSKGGIHCHCFACGAHYDTFDLIGLDYGLTGKDIFKKAYELYDVKMDRVADASKKDEIQQIKPKKNNQDFSLEVKEAHQELLTNTEIMNYLMNTRGLERELINSYMIGYDGQGYDHFMRNHEHKTLQNEKAYCIVLPILSESGVYDLCILESKNRALTGKAKYINSSSTKLLNERYLKLNKDIIFITEGFYDALSIEQGGCYAISLNSVGNTNRLIDLCRQYKPTSTFVLMLDNDRQGQEATSKLHKGLSELNIPHIIKTLDKHKDANEYLVADKEGFYAFVKEAYNEALQEAKRSQEALKNEYMKNSTKSHLDEFLKGIKDSVNTPCISTGFNILDTVLDGGLYEGLYVVGAIPSLGKTTFVLQIADQVARNGQDVLIFSLEMARNELIAKSISRHTIINVLDHKLDIRNAKTVRGITVGKRYENYSTTEMDLIDESIADYAEYAQHVYVVEGMGDIGFKQIKEAVESHIQITGNVPVVVVDYMQLMAPYDVRATDKQNADKNTLELKRLSRDYKTPVIAISSFNRTNYNGKVSMSAFKESGGIEYGCDVLIGLQYHGQGENNFDEIEAKTKNPREIEAVILKNRNGEIGKVVNFQYYSMFNYYKNINLFSE